MNKTHGTTKGDDWLDKQLHQIIARHDGLHGITHNIMGGKMLSEEHCANCRETAESLKAAIQAQVDAAYQRGQDEELSPIPMVNGLDCPACGHPTLILGNGGYITCSLEGCPNPDYAEAAQAHVDEAVREAFDAGYNADEGEDHKHWDSTDAFKRWQLTTQSKSEEDE